MAGIYIHIPFCKQACNYCNFHFSVSLKNKAVLVKALVKEIELSGGYIEDKNIETIYIGGGTPSLLNEEDLQYIFEALHKKFSITFDAEITLEANPDDINIEILNIWKKMGINRLSVGLQSFNEDELKWMNRAHNATQSLQCLDDIKKEGFTNFSVDLIYGSPLQNNEDLKRNFDIIAERNIPHISCYALTVEPGTILNKKIKEHQSPAVDADKQAEQFYLLLGMMADNGYEQYEISNFCKPGYRSKHNSSYWQGKPYFGFGPAAHSFNGFDKRRWNVSNNSLYIQSLEKNIIPFEEEILTEVQRLNEYVMTSLRTIEGINIEYIEQYFGKENARIIIKDAQKYIVSKKVILTNERLKLSEEGKFFADGIASDLFR
ncbi:MAG: radical SAM family heme chaperone HemW [Ferruginibacter sp.]|nr:radical SAM family heme chaperone HemW [Ferruginibacter sp.]